MFESPETMMLHSRIFESLTATLKYGEKMFGRLATMLKAHLHEIFHFILVWPKEPI
jgi:hypothetical protein